jgi:branched-chain amino acid transport system substrate-binding protein
MKKLISILSVIAMLVLILSACSSPPSTASSAPENSGEAPTSAPTGDPIIVGGIADLSGNGSVLGNACRMGWELAVEDINAAGGVMGRPLKLITYDCKSDPQESISVFQRLSTVDGASIVFGPPLSNVGLAVAPYADELGLPFLGQFGDPRCMLGENLDSLHEYMFLMQPSSIQSGILMGAYMVETFDYKSVAMLIAEDHSFCASQANAFMEYAKENNIEIKTVQYCKQADTDMTVQLTAIKNSGADFVYTALPTQPLVVATNQMYQMGIDLPKTGANDFSNPFNDLVSDPAAASGIYYALNLDMSDPSLSDVTSRYKAKFNEDPTPKSFLSYDTVLIAAAAMEKAQSADRVAIHDALADISGVDTLITDNFTMDPKTHMPLGLEMVISNLENGVYTYKGWYVPEYLK